MYNQHKRRKDKHLFADISFFFYRNLFLPRLQLNRKKNFTNQNNNNIRFIKLNTPQISKIKRTVVNV